MKTYKCNIFKKAIVLFFSFVFVISSVSDNSALIGKADTSSAVYIGTMTHDGVPALTAGGGYKFYSDPECSIVKVGGSHQPDTSKSDYSLYIKADKGYEINNVTVKYYDGTLSPAVVSESSGVYTVKVPQGTVIEKNLIISVGTSLLSDDIISVNFALLEWKSKGEHGSLTVKIDGVETVVNSTSSYDSAYDTVFTKLWNHASAVDYPNITAEKELKNNETIIYRVSGDSNKLTNNYIIHKGVTVIFLAENEATIYAAGTGKITLAGGNLSVQGKSETKRLHFSGLKTDKETTVTRTIGLKAGTGHKIVNGSRENLIQIRLGKAYFEYAQIEKLYSNSKKTEEGVSTGTGTQGGALQILPYGGATDDYTEYLNKPAYLYVSDMIFLDCEAKCGGGFGSPTTVKDTEVYFYKTTFDSCISSGNINNAGGGAVRAGSGSGLFTFHECTFTNNSLDKAFHRTKGNDAGGAVRWNIGAKDLYTGIFNGCVFDGNKSDGRGGAIITAGGMQLNACTLTNNEARFSGGAVLVVAHTQNTQVNKPDDMDGTVIFGPGTRIYNNKVTSEYAEDLGLEEVKKSDNFETTFEKEIGVNGLGGAIHVRVDISKAGTGEVKNYRLITEVRGAEIYGNTAPRGGGIAVSVTHNYECGVFVYEGSSIHDNYASDEEKTTYGYGGAIYIESNETKKGVSYGNNKGFMIEGGSVFENEAKYGGAVYLQKGDVNMKGGTISGNEAKTDGGGVYLESGNFNMSAGTIEGNRAYTNGGASYLAGGTVNITGGSIVSNIADSNGGAVYMSGGLFNMDGGTLESNKAVNGAGAYVANGNVNVKDGTLLQNKASQNGGGIYVSDGNYNMTGGNITQNEAANGEGGGIYVSSSKNNTQINIYSGTITNNTAGTSGGALGVYGQDGVSFTITIGRNVLHEGEDCTSHKHEGQDETCPKISANEAAKSGGGIYLSGSYEATMNIYCIIESDNKAEGGISQSNFMKVEGGTLMISAEGANEEEHHGNVVINSSVHVTGGRVTLEGLGDNPLFNQSITVDVDESKGSYFHDNQKRLRVRHILYSTLKILK